MLLIYFAVMAIVFSLMIAFYELRIRRLKVRLYHSLAKRKEALSAADEYGAAIIQAFNRFRFQGLDGEMAKAVSFLAFGYLKLIMDEDPAEVIAVVNEVEGIPPDVCERITQEGISRDTFSQVFMAIDLVAHLQKLYCK